MHLSVLLLHQQQRETVFVNVPVLNLFSCPQGCRQHVVFAPVVGALRSVFTTFHFKNLLSLQIVSQQSQSQPSCSIRL